MISRRPSTPTCFVPKIPNRDSSDGDRDFDRPYTCLYLAGLKAGFTTSDLRAMGYSRLLCFLEANIEMNATNESGGSRMANQDDIDWLTG